MQDTEEKARQTVVEKFASKVKPRHEPEVQETLEAYQDARAHVREALMLDVRLADGTIESFDYASLRRVRFIPGDTLALTFGGQVVTAEGRNLAPTRDAIAEHRRRYITEGTDAESRLKPETEAYIEKISITEREDELI